MRELARQLGYRPSSRARNLAMGRQATLRCAVVSLDLSASGLPQSVYGPTLPGILAGAAAEGMDIQLAVMEKKDPSAELARFLAEDRADGILLLTAAAFRSADVAPLEDAGVPYVLVNRHFSHEQGQVSVNCVTPDWVGGTRDAVRRLHRLGHRRMAAIFAGDASGTSTALDHEQGWREGLAECGIDPGGAPIVRPSGPLSRSAGYEIGRRLLTEGLPGSGERVTAVVAYNDHVAHGVLRAARELAVGVPDELSVIGFDNSIGQYLWPALCSYDPHLYDTGEQAALLLAELMRGDGDDGGPEPESDTRRVMVPLDYICRDTCAPAP